MGNSNKYKPKNQSKPKPRYLTSSVLYSGYIYIYGGAEVFIDHDKSLNDFWRVILLSKLIFQV